MLEAGLLAAAVVCVCTFAFKKRSKNYFFPEIPGSLYLFIGGFNDFRRISYI